MRFEGILSAWNPDAGYGTIRPSGGGEEVFVGLAAFPTDGEGPRMDEPLTFEIVTSRDGRKQAVNLKRRSQPHLSPALRASAGGTRVRVRQAQKKRRLALMVTGAVVTVMLVAGGVHWWQPGERAGEAPALRR
jgi:cold shock CspA family protein